jgi:hypothetical protein
MTARLVAKVSLLTVAYLAGVIQQAEAQVQPGAPQLTATTGSITDLPPGSSVGFTLNLGNNLGNGQTINPATIGIDFTDASGNSIIPSVKNRVVAVTDPTTGVVLSYNVNFSITMPGPGDTKYKIIYSFETAAGGFQGGDVEIATGQPS